MKKVYLFLKDICLCQIEGDEELKITQLEKNISSAKKTYPLQMMFYKKGLSGLPHPLEVFVGGLDRADIKESAQIKDTDNLFERLYKFAGQKIAPYNGFIIVRE